MLPEFTQHDFADALDRVINSIFEFAGGPVAPINAIQLAQSLGLVVASDESQAGRARFVRLRGFETNSSGGPEQGSIMVRSDPRRERLHWAVAHEIGEHFAHRVFADLGVDPREVRPGAREDVANRLAARLLLPTELFGGEALECDWDLPRLKTHYATASHELIARRMLDFEPRITITILDHARVSFRSSNLSYRAPALLPLEKSCWQRTHESGQPAADEDEQISALAWPVHEAEWKREILRTAWREWEC